MIEDMVFIVRELYPEEDTETIEDLQYYIEEQFDVEVNKDDLKPFINAPLEQEDTYLQQKNLGLR